MAGDDVERPLKLENRERVRVHRKPACTRVQQKARSRGRNRSFGLRPLWAMDSPLPAQLLACDRVDRAAFRASLELRDDSSNDRAMFVALAPMAARTRREFSGVDLCWKRSLQCRELSERSFATRSSALGGKTTRSPRAGA